MVTTDHEAIEDALAYIRRTYGVPARIGVRVRYTGDPSVRPMDGTIAGAKGQYLLVDMDPYWPVEGASPTLFILHPTWDVEYLDAEHG
jgi:hypothetical protein